MQERRRIRMLIQTGIPDKEAIEAVTPDETRFL